MTDTFAIGVDATIVITMTLNNHGLLMQTQDGTAESTGTGSSLHSPASLSSKCKRTYDVSNDIESCYYGCSSYHGSSFTDTIAYDDDYNGNGPSVFFAGDSWRHEQQWNNRQPNRPICKL